MYVRAIPKANFRLHIDGVVHINPIEDFASEMENGEGAVTTVKLQAGQTVHASTGNEPCEVYAGPNGAQSWFGGHLLSPEVQTRL